MKTLFKYITAAAICILFNSCQKELYVAVSNISLNSESITLLSGTVDSSLVATISPSNATNQKVLWSTSNQNIATVKDGIIHANNPGNAIIRVKSDDGAITADCQVTVVSELIHVSGIELLNEDGGKLKSLRLAKGDSTLVVAMVTPDNATDKTVIWKSSDNSLMTVTSEGMVKALKPGNAVLIATTFDGAYTATCNVDIICPAAKIVLDSSRLVLNEYDSYLLKARVEPADYNAELIWSSGDESLVKVYNGMLIAGKMKENGESKTIVTISSKNDPEVKAQCEIEVVCKVAGVHFEYPELYVKEEESIEAAINVYPKRALNKKVSLSSSAEQTASIEDISYSNDRVLGIIKGNHPGEATLTVETEDGRFSAKATVHVFSRVDGIVLDKDNLELDIDDDKDGKQLTASISPKQASMPDIRWTSNNEKVAIVDGPGLVKPVSAGTATVIASTVDGGLVASCDVNVVSKLKKISLVQQGPIDIYEGSSMLLDIKYDPEDATDKEVLWTSSDTTVARVVNGTLISMKSGRAEITVQAKNREEVSDKRVVNVISKITGVTLDNVDLKLEKGQTFKLTATVSPDGVPDKDKSLEWISSQESVATVDNDGLVTANASGNAVVTVYTKGREFSANCNVTVINPVTSFDLKAENDKTGVFENESIQIFPVNIQPEDADGIEYEWESSNPDIAFVDNTGLVTGTASTSKDCNVTITASVKGHSDIKASIKLNILAHVREVYFEPAELTLYTKGDNHAKTVVKVKPEWAAVQEMESVEPLNTDLIVIQKKTDGEYSVIALSGTHGKTQIKAVSKDGKIEGYCTVSVFDEVPVDDLILTPSEPQTIHKGQRIKITAEVKPEGADQSVSWESDNDEVASVANGTVQGNECGTATITATAGRGNIKKSLRVTVTDAEVKVEDIQLSQTMVTLKVNETKDLKATATPTDATNKKLSWSSKDGTVARIDQNPDGSLGTITAKKVGTTEIYVETTDGSNIKKVVTVNVESSQEIVHVDGVTLNYSSRKIDKDASFELVATVSPNNAENQEVKWVISEGEGVVSIEPYPNKCRVTGLRNGKATIKVITEDGSKTASCVVEVCEVIHVQRIELDKNTVDLALNQSAMIYATVYPENASILDVNIRVSTGFVDVIKTEIVNRNGNVTQIRVTGLKETADGSPARLTVESQDIQRLPDGSEFVVEIGCQVSVKTIKVESVSLDRTELTLKEGRSVSLKASIFPENATDKRMLWTSSSNSVATADQTGKIKAVSQGEAKITVCSFDGSRTAECNIRVISSEVEGGGTEGLEFEDLN